MMRVGFVSLAGLACLVVLACGQILGIADDDPPPDDDDDE